MRTVIGRMSQESEEYETMTISGDEIELLLTYRELSPEQRNVLKGISTLLLENNDKKGVERHTSTTARKGRKRQKRKR